MKTSTKIISVSAFFSLLIILIFIYFTLKTNDSALEKKQNKKKLKTETTEKQIDKKTIKIVEKTRQTQTNKTNIELNDSDYAVRIALNRCSLHPDINKVLKTDRIIRRFVASIENISNGESPAKNLDFLSLNQKFIISFNYKNKIIDPSSYKRYDYISELFISFDANKLIELYKVFNPLLVKAYKELGIPNSTFNKAFIEAIDILVSTPIVNGDIYLKKQIVTYKFLDKKLEQLNNAQKQFLRMGPSNIKIIKEKLLLIKLKFIKIK